MPLGIPEPPRKLYKAGLTATTQVTQETNYVYFIEQDDQGNFKIDYPEGGGIYVYKFGGQYEDKDGKVTIRNAVRLLYPEKGFPTPEALSAVNISKRALMGYVRFFTTPLIMILLSPLILIPWKWKIRILDKWAMGFASVGYMSLEPHIMEDRYYTKICRSLNLFLRDVVMQISEDNSRGMRKAIEVFINMIEYDTAYRYPLQDVLSETTKDKLLKDPRKEIKRLVNILSTRHKKTHIAEKFKQVGTLLSLLLLHPKIKRYFKIALERADLEAMQFDEADRYHVMSLDGYDFFGEQHAIRVQRYLDMHNGIPPSPIEVKSMV